MNWRSELSREAERQLARLPRDIQKRIGRAIDTLEVDPFQGDVISLKGRQWHGRYRKRVGRYRIIFMAHRDTRVIEISAILVRGEQTYK
ncbi:MAG: type II toxin-antitoxin system RelE/ParE family toxin [bacterium]|nr:type II toxin-antitoxin system RelE/ParE family toxin [bacterium]MDZ4299812.1 type II toxin-antitoxin system RelE/ParE family toxin [Candidatus Sungbacteria bacterium]